MTSVVVQPPMSCKVYTPSDLAAAIIGAVRTKSNGSWLEPSCGGGAFIDELSNRGVPKRKIVGIDLDSEICEADDRALTSRGIDFLEWSSRTRRRFDRIVGNPPYLQIRGLPSPLLECAESVIDLDGEKIGKRANIWYAFVCSSVRLLNPGGAIGFVLPAALEFADYARPLIVNLTTRFTYVEILRCSQPMFNDVGEGSVVLVARGYKRGKCRPHKRTYATRASLIRGLGNSSPRARVQKPRKRARPSRVRSRPLPDVMTVRIGGVTGDVRFFLLTESQRTELALPVASCRPVVTRASHLKSAFIGRREWEALRDQGERIWLFDPPPRLHSHEAVQRYLNEGGCNRKATKVSARDPWFKTVLPSRVHGFVSGMSRLGPCISFGEMPRLSASNTLYVVEFSAKISEQQRPSWALAMLSTPVQRQLKLLARHYPQGLAKFEPGDLGRLLLPEPPKLDNPAAAYRRAVLALTNSGTESAALIADAALEL